MATIMPFTAVLSVLGLALAGPALAQDASQDGAADGIPGVDSAVSGARSYEPAYFARYSPRNARDMVERIPGFRISEGNNERGLGQTRQNVLINGDRFSGKSDSVVRQLQRIPASDVVRIDIVDGTTLDIPGLAGQVANVIVRASSGLSGQFRYVAALRPYNAKPRLFGGEASLTGKSGALEYTVSISNPNDRGGSDGPIYITDAGGALVEVQDYKNSNGFDNPILGTTFTYRFAGGAVANLNLRYGEDFVFRNEPETGFPVDGPVRYRFGKVREDGPEYEIGGDVEFGLGPGRLKLIGLERFERDNYVSTRIDSFDDGSGDVGSRFTQINEIGERIGRFEYGWRMFAADWQFAGEAAFNRLDRRSALFDLDPGGDFRPLPFPAGTGGVLEDRYEGTLSFSKPITGTLAFQATGGGEYSRIEQTGSAANSRTFRRPKGSASLAWRPDAVFDASVKLAREVGQLSFGDFLASVALNDETESQGNNALEPAQSWVLDIEANRRIGPWGSLKIELQRKWFQDLVDYFPLKSGGEARGNIGDADVARITGTATIKFDPIGWRGAQLDVKGMKARLTVIDPFTGILRPISSNTRDFLEVDFRQDLPGTDWAYGASYFTNDNAPYFRRFETGRSIEGPGFLDLFVEHKDVAGLTVNAMVANVLGATQQFDRTVFLGDRSAGIVRFRETSDRRIGPIFRVAVSGNF